MDDRLADELMELAFRLAGRIRTGIDRTATGLDLPPAQAQALMHLRSPAPMRELADIMACDASNVTGIVDGLERRGLVQRRPDPRDRRVKNLVLTEEGEAKRDALRAGISEVAAEVFHLPAADRRALRDLFRKMLDDPADGPVGAPTGASALSRPE
ncbi:MarR family winged helix-turn-helix transcriptional regulator [Actinomadura sp. 21ATH]|uniref:MarR family winged helix-turn-helix transcriptional regulator n=1 Tax=Actinomadura sp. 21ATH TaxID=1735444 RepID=UPI0035C09494